MSTALQSFVPKVNVPTLSGKELADAIDHGQNANDSHGSSDGVQYLSFSGKLGRYSLGKAKDNMDPEDVYLVEPMSLLAGWICWKGSKPVARHEWHFFGGKPVAEGDLEDHGPYNEKLGDGWSTLLGFGCVTLDGQATSIKFSSNTVSAKNAISDLIDEMKQRAAAGEAELPLIHFDVEEFEAQSQKNFKPKFVVESWVTREQAALFFNGTFSADDLIAAKQPTKAQLKKLG